MNAKPEYIKGDLLVCCSDNIISQRAYFVRGELGIAAFMTTFDSDAGENITSLVESIPEENFFHRPKKETKERRDFDRISSIIGGILEDGPVKLSRLVEEVQSKLDSDSDFVSNCIRAFVALDNIIVKESSDDVEVRLSTTRRELERQRAYAAAFAHELESQSVQIGRLIDHGGSIGSHREELLRALIQNHIPRRFHAATGFIFGFKHQLDILIYDCIEYSPLFKAGDLVVVSPESVRAIIEVKSNLTSDELADALRHIEGARPYNVVGPPIFAGVFGYSGASAKTLIKTIKKFYNHDNIEAPEDFHSIAGPDDLINAICVLRKTIIFMDFLPTGTGEDFAYIPSVMLLQTWSQRNSEAAAFFDYLSRFLRYPFDGERNDHGMSALLAGDLHTKQIEPIYGRQWGPYDLDTEVEFFEGNIRSFRGWVNGASWSKN